MEEYRLIYFHKETGKEYRGKMVTRLNYILVDPETQEKIPISRHALTRDYRASKKNSKANPRNKFYPRRLTKKSA